MNQPRANRRARLATMLAFATNGALPATLLARYAEVKDALGLDAGTFGLVVAAYMVGAACAFHLPGLILRRIGTRWTTSLGTTWVGFSVVTAALGATLGSPLLFAAGMACAGLGDAIVDVAQNAQGLRVQAAYGRSLLNSMHAGWSIGAAVGGAAGTLAATLGVPLPAHLAAWAIVCAATMALSSARFLPDRRADLPADGHSEARLGRRAILLLLPLALVALAGISVEDIGNNWSAVLLSSERGMALSSAGIGLTILLGAQFVGRITGDRFIDRVGSRAALVTSLALVSVGLILAAWMPSAALTIAGLAVAGLGCAITVPIAFSEADALPGLKAHAGVTWINWLMRAATVGLTPAIGGVTSLSSLPVAITLIALVAVVALATQLRPRRRSENP